MCDFTRLITMVWLTQIGAVTVTSYKLPGTAVDRVIHSDPLPLVVIEVRGLMSHFSHDGGGMF